MVTQELSRKTASHILLIGLLFCFLIVCGCAMNPAKKEREFMIVSEEKEFRIGQGVDKQVREDMGVYLELPQLRSLVKEVGENIGRNSDRPDLIYRIEIIDSPSFNAFAVPGGFVYVHRGLLERMNSVDDLASVLGHEIGHVAARHSAAQISKAQIMNIGLLGLSVATKGAVQDYGRLINMGAALAFNKFSRDDEREADYFGTKYMTLAGYNPKASIDVMMQIKKLETKEPTTFEVWFMTHPPTEERLVNLNHEIEEIGMEQPAALNRPVQRNKYVALLDGMVVGEWNGNELIRGDSYYNKEFLLSLKMPEGWQARINSKDYTAVFANPKKKFAAYFGIEPLRIRTHTADYFQDFNKQLKRFGLRKVKGISTDRPLAHGALMSVYSGYDKNGEAIMVEGIAFVKGANGYFFTGFSKKGDFEAFRTQMESMVESLRFLPQREVDEFEPPRLRIHTVEEGGTWENITQKYFNSSEGKKKLAGYNGFEESQQPSAGTLLKIPPSLRF